MKHADGHRACRSSGVGALSTLARNLRLLCSYDGSLSRICRRTRVSRQQLGRYLKGEARPSLATLRRLCDYFGVEDHEIHFDYETFRRLVRRNPPQPDTAKDAHDVFTSHLAGSDPRSLVETHGLAGFYHVYHRPRLPQDQVICSLTRLFLHEGAFRTRTVERYRTGDVMHASILKYEGFALASDHHLYVHESQRFGPWQKWTTVLTVPFHSHAAFLSGISLGTTPDTDQLVSYRVVWSRVDHSIRLRMALAACGSFPPDHPSLPAFVPAATCNASESADAAFTTRLR